MVKHNECENCIYGEFQEDVYEITNCSIHQSIEQDYCDFYEEKNLE